MTYELVQYNSDYFDKWNQFLKKSRNNIFLFDRNYMEYHKERFVDDSLIINKRGKTIALFPANKAETTLYSHQGLTFGGLIYSYDFKTTDAIEVMHAVRDHYQARGYKELIYKTIPYVFQNYPSQEDLYALFRLDASLYRRDVFSVVSQKNKIRFSETKRQLISKCEKTEVKCRESNDFDAYWNLLDIVLAKHNTTPVHSVQEIKYLKEKFPQEIKLFIAEKDKEILAGIIIYDYGNVIHTQYMANSHKGREIGALDFLNYKLINELYSDREYYSFGTSNEREGRILNEGLSQQKELMGGRAVSHDFYKIILG